MTEKKECKNSILIKLLPFMLAFLGTASLRGIIALADSSSIAYTNSFFAVLVFAASTYILNRELPIFIIAGKRKHIFATVYSFLLSLAMQLGASMEVYDNVRFTDITLWLRVVGMTLFVAPIINTIWDKLSVLFNNSKEKDTNKSEKKTKPLNFYQIWGIIFLLWLPTMLALYPGAFVYDAQDEYIEVISRAFTMHHPLLHVLLLGGIIHAAEYVGWTANSGIAIYVVLQMLLLSWIFAYSIKMLEKWGMKKKLLAGTMAFFCLFPLFPLYSVCTAKDTLFSGFFLLVVLMLVDIKKGHFFEMKEMLLFVFSSVIMMLLRNNGMYAYLVAIPIIYIALVMESKARADRRKDNSDTDKPQEDSIKEDKKESKEKTKQFTSPVKLAIIMLLSVVLFFGVNYILKTVTDAESNEHQEMLTVPIQQLSRAYKYSPEAFTSEDVEALHEILPEDSLITYNLRISDVLKSGFDNVAYSSNPSKYRSLWAKIGMKKPLVYINGWLGTSYGYWYPDALNNVYSGNQMYTFQYGESSYFGFETEPPGKRESKFRVLELFYENMSLKLFQQKVPVVSMLFSPGFMFWVFATVFMLLLREKKNVIPLIPVLLLWLTVLLGPTTIVRYVLILWYVIPLYPVLFYDDKKGV